jgi:hypothetical protein
MVSESLSFPPFFANHTEGGHEKGEEVWVLADSLTLPSQITPTGVTKLGRGGGVSGLTHRGRASFPRFSTVSWRKLSASSLGS